MIQIEAMRDKIGALKKDIKENYGNNTKVATIRKENLQEEEKWEEIKDFVEACS